jgi:hypothetical protein
MATGAVALAFLAEDSPASGAFVFCLVEEEFLGGGSDGAMGMVSCHPFLLGGFERERSVVDVAAKEGEVFVGERVGAAGVDLADSGGVVFKRGVGGRGECVLVKTAGDGLVARELFRPEGTEGGADEVDVGLAAV